MNNLHLCNEATRSQCAYFSFSQNNDDLLDIISALIAYIVLWVFPEKTLFPTGLAMYTIPCIFSVVKFWHHPSGCLWVKWLLLGIVSCLCIVSLLGLNGLFQCMIMSGTNYVILNESLASLIALSKFPTVWLLFGAGVPVVFNTIRYVFSTAGKQRRSTTAQAA